ncbi:hypothetical protein ANRL2_03373 [Anaerolineae bacterium]|nr:hypothetical protein ANRL2_03373 [Anaerolineae bacterium]
MPTQLPLFAYPLVSQVSFDSAALTMKAVLAHPLRQAGTYHGIVMLGERFLAGFVVEVTEAAEAVQVNVDLAELHQLGRGTAPNEVVKRYEIKVGGWVVCHVSHGEGGYYATLRKVSQRTIWDSHQLESGDIFSMIPLRPGIYSLSNLANPNHAAVPLVVEYPDPRANERRRSRPLPIYAVCRDSGFEPSEIHLRPGQGMVLTIETRAHIHLTLQRPDDGSEELRQWYADQQAELIRRTHQRGRPRTRQA